MPSSPARLDALPTVLKSRQDPHLIGLFWLLSSSILLYILFWTTAALSSQFAAILIALSALLPSYLWCFNSRIGMPIYPLFALTFLWTYALPLISDHPRVLEYSSQAHLSVGMTISSALLLGTCAWYYTIRQRRKISLSYRGLSSRRGERLFFSVIATSVLFNVALVGGWFSLSGGAFSIIRGAVLGLTSLGVFVLGYRLGRRELSRNQASYFLFLIVAYCISSAMSLLLVQSASIVLIVTIAFIIGRRKFPVVPILIFLVCMSFFHYGKGDMRHKYWNRGYSAYVQPWQYPARYIEWANYSIDYWTTQQSSAVSIQKRQSIAERSSIVQLLLLAQDKTPSAVPYLDGKTYFILPQLIVPRIFNEDKISSHEGTTLLNIHYGLQTRESSRTTTIGWGLMAEAYANFGVSGCWILTTLLGGLYGKLAQLSVNTSILSAQSLFSVLFMTFAFQSEWSAGVYVAALCQSSVVISILVVFLMRPQLSEEALKQCVGYR